MIKLKDLLTEKRGIGGYYLMKMLKDMANDVKRDDKKLYKALMFLHDRINQSARDVDLDADDLNDFLNDPRGRKYAKDLPDWMIDDLFEGSLKTERKFHHKNKGDNYLGGYNDNKGNNTEMWGAKDGTFYIWVQKKGGAEAYLDLPKNVKDRAKADKIHHKLTRDFKKESA